jgi:hypothetical protein
MNQKYNISSISTLFTISVRFSDIENQNAENKELQVLLDYENDKVFFTDKTDKSLDYEQLEKEILDALRPREIETPIVPDCVFRKDWQTPDVFGQGKSVFEGEI